MNLIIIFTWLFFTAVAAISSRNQDDQAHATKQLTKWQTQYENYIEATVKTRRSGCNAHNILHRQEWGVMSKKCRLDYIKAVQCLQQKPPLTSPVEVPGVRSHYDDFSAIHIIKTPFVHFSGLFLPFHRYFVWLYEKSLREQCGYTGAQPYWDWTLSWKDPRKSTVFDGSPYSMGSNGASISHGPTNISAFGLSLTIPPATGGGCVYSGPFTNYTVNLGPVAFEPKGGDGGLAYNPRCLVRDLSPAWSSQTKPTDVVRLLENCTEIGCFDTVLEALDGVHAGGHFTMGGLGIDAYSSAGDPAFWLHHAMIDRVWTVWQNLDPEKRTNQVWGTATAFNNPPSPNVTLDTDVDFGVLSSQQRVRSLVSTIDGPFCYVYD